MWRHVPMFDDPDLVASTILETTRAVPSRSESKAVASNM